ncbi:hypothetical protein [Streptomyces rishiriensis]|uniref:Serine/threonine protein kinase n=1 Tax=Streptomyces rishiriensis TaxID=68264 RepID=A0ABU0NV08_STRRH|nr:hypothetical protein [Streptomyces rishiriensis]MDQ0582949.1 hypothetical protein [Streptomyces rishiriensis]
MTKAEQGEERAGEEVEAGEVEPQDALVLREFGEDAGTVRVRTARPDAGRVRVGVAPPEAAQSSVPLPVNDAPGPRLPHPASATGPGPARAGRLRRSSTRRSLTLAVLAGLLCGGAWWGSDRLGGTDSGAAERPVTYSGSASTTPSASAVAGTRWVAHREAGLDAVLSLPSGYRQSARQDGADQEPRLVVYSAGPVDVRLTLWDKAPAAPMARAAQTHDTWNGYAPDARTQTTRTTFHGAEAALADTTYALDDAPTRVMELFVLTADARMYELRVVMPKGTPEEKQGTAVFKAARDRLEIGK